MEINNKLDFVSPDKLVYSEESIIRQLSFCPDLMPFGKKGYAEPVE